MDLIPVSSDCLQALSVFAVQSKSGGREGLGTRLDCPVPSFDCSYAGNSGFETADNIVGNAAYIHMVSRYVM